MGGVDGLNINDDNAFGLSYLGNLRFWRLRARERRREKTNCARLFNAQE